jgi:hypothetical protein
MLSLLISPNPAELTHPDALTVGLSTTDVSEDDGTTVVFGYCSPSGFCGELAGAMRAQTQRVLD